MIERLENRRRDAREGGFTLIELLVVITILGVLSAVVVFAVSGINDKGQTSACKIDTRTLATAEEAYLASSTAGNGQYGTEAQLVSGGFLSEVSQHHDITNIVVGTSTVVPRYDIVIADFNGNGATSQPCGTLGAVAGTTGNF